MGLDGTLYRLVLIAHILSAVAFLGPTFVLVAYDKIGERSGACVHLAVRRMNQLIAERWSGPGAGVVGLFGVVLVLLSDEAWSLSDTWVALALAADIALVVLALGIMAPVQRRISGVVEASAGTDDPGEQAGLKARHRRLEGIVIVTGGAMHALVIAMLSLMVFKPQ